MAQHIAIINLLNELQPHIEGNINKADVLNNLVLSNNKGGTSELERRAIDMSIDSEDKVDATSIKPYNMLKFSQTKFITSMLGVAGTAGGVATDMQVATIMGVLGVFGAFLMEIKKEYNQQDARVLYTIYHLGKHCHTSTIPPAFKTHFKEEISIDKLTKSLNELLKYKTIKRQGDEVEIIETVNLIR